jgi:acetyl-CoA carboxylase carboxyltransferase component
MAFEAEIAELARRRQVARAMGSERRLKAWAEAGILNVRQRLDYLLDADSFEESGLLALSARPEDHNRVPCDGTVDGFGRIDGRPVLVHAADFSAMGASSAEIAGLKMKDSVDTAVRSAIPLIMLNECSGARMPDVMGATGIHKTGEYYRLGRDRTVPQAAAVLGQSYGGGTWRSVTSDFTVMRKGAVMAVSSVNVTQVAIAEDEDPEDLGGWRMQTEVTGQVDQAVDTDEEAMDALKRFLSYLPSHCNEAPPRVPVSEGSGTEAERILELLPESRAKVYDVRKMVGLIVDRDSFFPIKERYSRVISTGLARIDGRAVAVIATNPMFKGGALDADACDKAINLIVLADSFNLPIITFADTPGFLVGTVGERLKLPGKIMNYMQALHMATVPKLSVIMRKSYGQAHLNMGAGVSDEMAAWFTADISFMDPEVGVNVVYRIRPEDDPERYAELARELARDTDAYDLAASYRAQTVLDLRETRDWLKAMLEKHERRLTGGVGEHKMRTWPTTF